VAVPAATKENVTGINIPYIANNLSGSFTSSTQGTFNVTGDIGQSGSASSTGSFEISGTVTFDTPCFSSGTIKAGAFPSGSYIVGNTVAFEFDTSNGVLAFLSNLNQDRNKIQGNYTISGGSCSDSGDAVLGITSPTHIDFWDLDGATHVWMYPFVEEFLTWKDPKNGQWLQSPWDY
jgi:hypothetical protein